MKNIGKRLGISLLSISSMALASPTTTANKTFFSQRSLGNDLALTHLCSEHFMIKHEPAPQFFLHLTPFYQGATNHSDLRKFFMPVDKKELVIKGALAEGERDISGTWLQIAGKNSDATGNSVPAELGFTDDELTGDTKRGNVELFLNEYESKISVSPTYSAYGVIFQSYFNLDHVTKRLWSSFTLPFMQAQTNMHLREFDVKNAATSRTSVDDFLILDDSAAEQRHERMNVMQNLSALEAFNNPSWLYGKITNQDQKITGLGDLDWRLGYHLIRLNSFRLNLYSKVSIPTADKPKAAYLFEPTLGQGGHWGVGAGVTADFFVIHGKRINLSFATQIDYLYLISAEQKRSFDLVNNGPWSRYLLLVDTANEPDANKRTLIPGINVLTRNVNVRPDHDCNMLASMRFSVGSFFFESGYNLWLRSAERITLNNNFPTGLAIAGTHYGARDTDEAFEVRTFSKAKISSHLGSAPSGTPDETHTDDSASNPIKLSASDLDMSSAEHPRRVVHKIFLAGGIHTIWGGNPVQLGCGGSYEFSQKNRALDLWGVFFKVNIFV